MLISKELSAIGNVIIEKAISIEIALQNKKSYVFNTLQTEGTRQRFQ